MRAFMVIGTVRGGQALAPDDEPTLLERID
jgi:hypothetical protein